MNRNLSTTRKGTGRLHKDGVKRPNKRKRAGALGGFSQALTDMFTQKNLTAIAQKKAKAMAKS
jgi:hypothetical protein